MKKSFLLLLLFLPAALSFGHQKHKKSKTPVDGPYPKVWMGNVRTYYTCRDSILANPTLVTDSVGCRVSVFTISLQAPGHDFYGPIHANGWELTQQQKDLIKAWDYKDVTLYIQDIHLNCHESDATSPPFQLKFDH